ncbi:MAG TPA: YihY/virulence factor BrkB family protein, partial [Sphingomonadaceae bacterium]|nr:YihY/virulence factor BrkB family protein [Sphingomonadaceae bacterium]
AAESHLDNEAGRSARLARRHWRVIEIVRRVAVGTWNDGFIHAGNLAYMSLLAIFPFLILGALTVTAFGDEADRLAAVIAVERTLPPSVGGVIGSAARDAIEARGGLLLWVGLIALWTVSSLIETIRDILRRAYGTQHTMSFLWHRLLSTGMVVFAMVVLILALLVQVMIGAVEEAVDAWAPQLAYVLHSLAYSRILPALVVFLAIYALFQALTPVKYRSRRYPKWPGALTVTLWSVLVTLAFPPALRSMFAYSMTYGSIAGIMITLFFFYLIGLGVVVGAELNAALARTPEEAREVDATDEEEAAR